MGALGDSRYEELMGFGEDSRKLRRNVLCHFLEDSISGSQCSMTIRHLQLPWAHRRPPVYPRNTNHLKERRDCEA